MNDTETRIRDRAHHIWEQEGRPDGRADEHWEQARFLVGLENSAGAGQLPNPSIPTVQNPGGTARMGEPVEPLREAVENLGEFPGLADQGEKAQAPLAELEPEPGAITPPPAKRRKAD